MLIVNPRSDEAFVARAHELLAGGAASVEELEAALRGEYPATRVHERSLSNETPAWYVYREGRWIPSGT